MKLQVLGAGREVGRSAFLLEDGIKILFDYGVKLSPDETEYPLPVSDNLDAAIISHAHLDHSGNLPFLYHKMKFPSYMTPLTLELSHMLWLDTIKIAGYENVTPLFDKVQVEKVVDKNFIRVDENASVVEVTSLLLHHNENAVVVTKEGRYLGMLSSRYIITKVMRT